MLSKQKLLFVVETWGMFGQEFKKTNKKKTALILIGRLRDCQIAEKKEINAENKSLLHGSVKSRSWAWEGEIG